MKSVFGGVLFEIAELKTEFEFDERMITLKKIGTILLVSLLTLTGCNKTNSTGEENPQAEGQKTVTIAVMMADPFLEKAAAEFEKIHQDIKIEIKSHLASSNGYAASISAADIEKYINTVTTQAISGKSSDLISMDILPQNKFVEKNVLANLYELMENDSAFDNKKYFQNVFKSFQDGNGLYAMPLSFSIDAIQGNSELLKKANISINDLTWTWSQFADITTKLKEQNGDDYLAFANPSQLLADYITENYSDLLGQGSPNFDSEAFRDAMKQIKTIFNEKIIEAMYQPDATKVLFSLRGLNNPKNTLLSMLDPKFEYFHKPTINGNSDGWKFNSYTTFGINNKSQVKQEAWEFLKFLVSEEAQTSPELMGFPINKAALDKKLEEIEQNLEQGQLEVDFIMPDSKTIQEKMQTLKSLLEGDGGEKQFSDQKLLMIAFEEFGSYLQGQKSVEDVSKLIQNRVKTYLNE